MPIIKIKKEDKSRRLDVFLTEKYPEESRTFWQKQIKNGLVLINDKDAKVHQFLKEGDKIKIKKPKCNTPKPIHSKFKYKLLHEDKHYLIVEKPAGLLTHEAGGEKGLADQIVRDYAEIEGVGENYRWGIVHRLDRDVGGVLLVARTQQFFKYIKKQFKNRQVKKIYLALVYGEIEADDGEINFVIARAKDGRMAARPSEADGREAATRFEVLERFRNYTCMRVQILTGRTHQIRVHMLAYGNPIVGDKTYKVRKQKIKEPCELDRIFLHSHIIGFKDLEKKKVEYKSKLPAKLNKCLKGLK